MLIRILVVLIGWHFCWQASAATEMIPVHRLSPFQLDMDQVNRVTLHALRENCITKNTSCKDRHAIVFVHGIFGDHATFENWPDLLQEKYFHDGVDIFVLAYPTVLLEWVKRNASSLDSVVDAVFGRLSPLVEDLPSESYSSVNFIAHSLGGNVVGAYLHTVKSLFGHEKRARHGFVVTLGTPVLGADIANVGVYLKSLLPRQRDPLLKSLERENTFLRMMRYWRLLENQKAQTFHCRPVNLYVGVEGKPMMGVKVVPEESARAMESIAAKNYKINGTNDLIVNPRIFHNLNHSQLAQPSAHGSEMKEWIDDILKFELQRLSPLGRDVNLCRPAP